MDKQNVKTYLWDSSSRASNPGYLPLSYLRWIRFAGWPMLRRVFFILLWLGLALSVHWAFGLLCFFSLGNLIANLLALHDVFLLGDTLPGIVVDENRGLVATGTNMTRMVGNYPVVAFFRAKLPADYRRNGTRVPVIASYGYDQEGIPYWDQLFPNSVLSGVDDEMLIRQKLNSIPEAEWQKLSRQVGQMNKPHFIGLYAVDKEDTGWKAHPNAVLSHKLDSWNGKLFPLLVLLFFISMIKKIIPGRKSD